MPSLSDCHDHTRMGNRHDHTRVRNRHDNLVGNRHRDQHSENCYSVETRVEMRQGMWTCAYALLSEYLLLHCFVALTAGL
jgi:hypothetical protein